MAKSNQPSQNKNSDTFTAKRTLNFLGRCLREQRFILRAQRVKLKNIKLEENETRLKIDNLHRRIHAEFAMNPGLFKKLTQG